MTEQLEQATLGGGCFWCTEAVFNQLKGIEKCESGYSGGDGGDYDGAPAQEEDDIPF